MSERDYRKLLHTFDGFVIAACGEIESRCVNIIARLFNAPVESPESQALGVSTIGSSEAIILSVRPIHLARIIRLDSHIT